MSALAGARAYAADVSGLAALTTGKPLVRLIAQTTQSLPNSTSTALQFGAGSEDVDTHGYHDPVTNPSRVTPGLAGYYRCTITVAIAASGALTQFYATMAKNGTAVQPLVRVKPYTTAAAMSVATTAILSANGSTDYFEGFGNQTSGGALNTQASGGINSVFEVEFLRPL
jgi:hypothetical protein